MSCACLVWLQEHKRIRGEYEARLRELEAERHMVEEDLAQVDRCVYGGVWVCCVGMEETVRDGWPTAVLQ